MHLLRLSTENCLGAPDGAWSFARGDVAQERVFVTGPASSGKTSFLRAIAALKESAGAYGPAPSPSRLLRRGAKSGRIEGTFLLSPEEVARAEAREPTFTAVLELGPDVVPTPADPSIRGLFSDFSRDPARGKVEYFPAHRDLGGVEHGLYSNRSRPLSPSAEARGRLSEARDKYAHLPAELVELALSDGLHALGESTARGVLFRADQRDSLAPYRADLATLLPDLRLAGVDSAPGSAPDLVFERRDGARLALADLSAAERQAFLFVVAFRSLGLSRSLVLIDGPELHVHPDLHASFAHALATLGAGNQVFFATSSPEVLRAAEPGEVIRLGQGARR